MNYTKLFYWLTVADNARAMFVAFIVIFMIIACISTIAYFITSANNDKDEALLATRWMWWSYPFCILFWSLYIFTPSKKDALLIVAGGQVANFLTTDESTKQIPKELSSFVLTELKNMASEAKVDLNITDQKDKILKEAENMTSEELLSKIKTDSIFAKIVLEKK